jgi:uncharacterized protein YcfJ
LENHVPEKSILYLTRSESEAKTVGKQFGAVAGGIVGGAAGMSAGVAAAALAVPGIGPVFALGLGAAASLGRGNGFGRRRKRCQRFRCPVVDIWDWFLRRSGLFPAS